MTAFFKHYTKSTDPAYVEYLRSTRRVRRKAVLRYFKERGYGSNVRTIATRVNRELRNRAPRPQTGMIAVNGGCGSIQPYETLPNNVRAKKTKREYYGNCYNLEMKSEREAKENARRHPRGHPPGPLDPIAIRGVPSYCNPHYNKRCRRRL